MKTLEVIMREKYQRLVTIKGIGKQSLDTAIFTFPDEGYYIVFADDQYQKYKILHNSFMNIEHNYYKNALKQFVPKGNTLKSFNFTCMGSFKTVFEAKLYAVRARLNYLHKRYKKLYTQAYPDIMSSMEIDAHRLHHTARIKGEIAKIDKLLYKWADKKPEYFI